MKNLIIIICLLAAITLLADLQDAEITVSSGSVNAGESITIEVSTTELIEDYDAISFQFTISFDYESITYSDYTVGDIFLDGMLLVNEPLPGELRAARAGVVAQTGSGVLLRLTFVGIDGSSTLDIHDFKYNNVLIENTTDGNIDVINNDITENIPAQITQVGIQSISPNPFNPSTTINFLVPVGESSLTLNIYSVRGQLVKRFHLNELSPNSLSNVNWQGLDEHGSEVASGIYFCEVKGATSKACSKMLLLK
ncbi:MAG: T9SS type A sorting domain-containing protein [Candidatus Stygibacter frigidus]|nr:T9SS type A sorting domain-containing protein [Candidatus Stygibacter frigidus]